MNTLKLQNLGLEEMNEMEMVETDGGILALALSACALVACGYGAGLAIGEGLYYATR